MVVRQRLVDARSFLAPASKPKAAAGLEQPPEPFTLVIQIDAWNIRERDHWGQTRKMRRSARQDSNAGIGFTPPPVSGSTTAAPRAVSKPNCAPSSPSAATWPPAAGSSR